MQTNPYILCDVYDVHGKFIHQAEFLSAPRTGEWIVFRNDPQRVLYVVLRVVHWAHSNLCAPYATTPEPIIRLIVGPEAARSDGRPHVPEYAFEPFTEAP